MKVCDHLEVPGKRFQRRPSRLLDALDQLVAAPADEPPRRVAPPSPRLALRRAALLDRRLIVPLAVLATLFCFSFIRQTDPDWWWHLRTGQLIWDTGAIPTTDSFSFTMAGRPWVAHEWLFDVLTYLGLGAFGYAGLSAIMAAIVTTTFTLHYLLLRALGAGRVLAGLLVAWSGLLSFMLITMRPQLFSYLFLSVELWVLYLYRAGWRRPIWLIPALMVPWVNLHGAWIMGLGVLALFVAGEWLNARTRREDRHLRPAMGALALGTLAVSLNPQFVRIYLFPLSFIRPDSAMVKYIQEWQSPNFHDFLGFVFGLSVLLLVLLGLRGPRFDYTLALWALAFTYLGFSAMRHLPLYALVVMPIVVARLPAAWRGAERPYRESRLTGIINWLLLAVGVGVVAVVMLGNPLAQLGQRPNLRWYPVSAVDYLRANPGPGNLLNYDGWGGYLIDELYPSRRVFIDTRVDLYGRQFLEEYIAATTLKPNWRDVLDRYQIAQVLLPPDSVLVTALRADPAWRVAFEETADGHRAVLLVRVTR